MKRERFNLKRVSTGYYISPDGRFSTHDCAPGWWAIYQVNEGDDVHALPASQHIRDVYSYSLARNEIRELCEREVGAA